MESMYENALKKIANDDTMLKLYKGRVKEIVYKTSGIGWGFHDNLVYLFYAYISEDEEEEEM